MKPETKKTSRWRRVFRWAGIFFFLIFIAAPTVIAAITRIRIASALRSASSVRLEEFVFQTVLTSRPLTPSEFDHVTDALPILPDLGIPGGYTMCFIPHHRVVITDRATQHDTTLTVCFHCDEVRLSGHQIMMTPYVWRRSLRQLFARHNIPIRDQYYRELMTQSE